MDFLDNMKERKKQQSEFQTGGRAKIDDMRRTRYSSRAVKGRLSVILQKCKHCNHHKAFQTDTLTKCTRCKMVVEQ